MCLKEWESFIRTHHFWWCKGLDRVILGPSISQEVFWTSLSCSHLHRFVSSTQSLTLWFGCHGQQEHYVQQGLCEQDCFRRDDSNVEKEGEKIKIGTIRLQLRSYYCLKRHGSRPGNWGQIIKRKILNWTDMNGWLKFIRNMPSLVRSTKTISPLKLIWNSNESKSNNSSSRKLTHLAFISCLWNSLKTVSLNDENRNWIEATLPQK